MSAQSTKRKTSSSSSAAVAPNKKRKAFDEEEDGDPREDAAEQQEEEIRHRAGGPRVDQAEGEEEEEEEEDEEGKLYCVCRSPYDGSFMVECDGCKQWFHPRCLGTTAKEVKRLKTFFCPGCKPPPPTQNGNQTATTQGANSAGQQQQQQQTSQAQQGKRESTGNGNGRKKTTTNTTTGEATVVAVAPSSSSDAADSSKEDDKVREYLRDQICDSLGGTDRARGIATDTELALFNSSSRSTRSSSYSQSARRIVFNLRDVKNSALRQRVLSGDLSPQSLAVATNEQLATCSSSSSAPGCIVGAAATVEVGPPAKKVKPAPFVLSRGGDGAQPAKSCWEGAVERNEKSGFGRVSVRGSFLAGDPGVDGLLPKSLEIAGRLEMDKLLNYLQQLSNSSSRRKEVLRLSPMSEADCEQFASIHCYFTDRDRAAFVKAVGSSSVPPPEELYMVPLSRSAPPPEFLAKDPSFSQAAMQAAPPDDRMLLLVLVAKITTISLSPKVHILPEPAAAAAAASAAPVASALATATASADVKVEEAPSKMDVVAEDKKPLPQQQAAHVEAPQMAHEATHVPGTTAQDVVAGRNGEAQASVGVAGSSQSPYPSISPVAPPPVVSPATESSVNHTSVVQAPASVPVPVPAPADSAPAEAAPVPSVVPVVAVPSAPANEKPEPPAEKPSDAPPAVPPPAAEPAEQQPPSGSTVDQPVAHSEEPKAVSSSSSSSVDATAAAPAPHP